MSAIVTRRLTRRYGRRGAGAGTVALAGLDLEVELGEVRGLLGPNGAGKTTLCKILSTVLLPSSGTAEVLGHDVVGARDRVKRSIGIVFGGDRGLYGQLTGRQNLRFWGALYGLHGAELRLRVDELLERTGLGERDGQRVDTYSRGMKQRLHLARGLVADPPVLILDEPTVGMDPVAALEVQGMIEQLRDDRRTVLITTHNMAEAEAVCDRVTLVDRGQALLTGQPDTIGSLVSRHERVDTGALEPPVRAAVSALPGVVSVVNRGGGVRVETRGHEGTAQVLAALVAAGVTDVRTGRPSLEEVYLHLVGDRGLGVDR